MHSDRICTLLLVFVKADIHLASNADTTLFSRQRHPCADSCHKCSYPLVILPALQAADTGEQDKEACIRTMPHVDKHASIPKQEEQRKPLANAPLRGLPLTHCSEVMNCVAIAPVKRSECFGE
jgi:hypothetical protein